MKESLLSIWIIGLLASCGSVNDLQLHTTGTSNESATVGGEGGEELSQERGQE